MSKLPCIYPLKQLIPVVNRSDEKQQIRFIRQVSKRIQREKRNSCKHRPSPEHCENQKQPRDVTHQNRIAKALDAINQIVRGKGESIVLKQSQQKTNYLTLSKKDRNNSSALSTKVKPMSTAQTQNIRAIALKTSRKENTFRTSLKIKKNKSSALPSKVIPPPKVQTLIKKHLTDETSAKNIKSSSPICLYKRKSGCNPITLINPSFPVEDRRPKKCRIQKYFEDLERDEKNIKKSAEDKISEKLKHIQKSKLPDTSDSPDYKLNSVGTSNEEDTVKDQRVQVILNKKKELDEQLKNMNINIKRFVREPKDLVNPSPLDDISFKTNPKCLQSEESEIPDTRPLSSQTNRPKYPVTQPLAVTKTPAASEYGLRPAPTLQFRTQHPAQNFEVHLPGPLKTTASQNEYMKPWFKQSTSAPTKKDEGFYAGLKKKLFFWRNKQTKDQTKPQNTNPFYSAPQSSSHFTPPSFPVVPMNSREVGFQLKQPYSVSQPQTALVQQPRSLQPQTFNNADASLPAVSNYSVTPSLKYQDKNPSIRYSTVKYTDAVRDFTSRNIAPPVTKHSDTPRRVVTPRATPSMPRLFVKPSVPLKPKPQSVPLQPPECFASQSPPQCYAFQSLPQSSASPSQPQSYAPQPQLQSFESQPQPQSFESQPQPQNFAYQPQPQNLPLQQQYLSYQPQHFALQPQNFVSLPQNVAYQPQLQNVFQPQLDNFGFPQTQPPNFSLGPQSQSYAFQPTPQMVHSAVILPINQATTTNYAQTPIVMQIKPHPYQAAVTKSMHQYPYQNAVRSVNPYPYQAPVTASMYQFPTYPYNPQPAAVTMPKQQLIRQPVTPVQQYPCIPAVKTSKHPVFYQSAVMTPMNQCSYVAAVPTVKQPYLYQTAIATPMYQYPNKTVLAAPKQPYLYHTAVSSPMLQHRRVY